MPSLCCFAPCYCKHPAKLGSGDGTLADASDEEEDDEGVEDGDDAARKRIHDLPQRSKPPEQPQHLRSTRLRAARRSWQTDTPLTHII
eukprot:582123-Rhodomonas_salina.2